MNSQTILQTDRLLLRPVQPTDQAHIFTGLSHPELIRHYGVSFATYEETAAQMSWYANLEQTGQGLWWVIAVLDAPATLVGAAGFSRVVAQHQRADMGYWLLPGHQGHGYMREALQAAIPFGFRHFDLHRIQLEIEPDNHRSLQLARALGFTYEGTLRECERKQGHRISLELYGLLAPEWTSPAPRGS